ncbi:Ras guanine nucleotide exchange factor glfB-like C-terminal domain-containing protein [Entamoeba marina]
MADNEKPSKHSFLGFFKKNKKTKKDKKDRQSEPSHTSHSPNNSNSDQSQRKSTGTGQITMKSLMKSLPDWQDSTRKVIAEGKFETFPIAGDLPRLLKHLSVVREVSEGDYDTIFPTEELEEKANSNIVHAGECLQVIKCIAKLLEGEAQASKVETEWNATIDNDEDMSVQKTFLMKILRETFIEQGPYKENSPVIVFLKAINQKIIASSTMRLKIVCGNLFFKDSQPMFWEVAVILVADKIYLIHYRKQETTSKKEDEYFRFLWELRLVFSMDMTHLEEVMMGVSCIEFNPQTKDDIKENVTSTLKPILFSDCQFRNVGDED